MPGGGETAREKQRHSTGPLGRNQTAIRAWWADRYETTIEAVHREFRPQVAVRLIE